MIGSPDVVAFTKEDEFGETHPDPWALPEEFSVPLHPLANSNPWAKTSYAKFTKDFILISEFSEQVGPQPLLTIPDDPKVCGTFDLNYFSLRIMSVDYQASFVGHPPGSGYPRLSFVEDSRVVLGDSKEGAFAYVHHLTLYDLEARGFVRPFCMAYVSADERKIMLQFQELSFRFSQASECLKTGNRRAFAKELQRKLRDLEYTRSVLQKEEGRHREARPQSIYSAHAVEKANEIANVEKSIYEHRDLLRQISSYPQRPRRDPSAVTCRKCLTECLSECQELPDKYANPLNANPSKPNCTGTEEAGETGEGQTPQNGTKEDEEEGVVKRRPSYTPQLIKAKSAKCFDKRLKTLTELCDKTFQEATVELLKETERSFRGDLCYLHTRRLDRTLCRKLRVTNFLFEEDLGDEDDDEEDGGTLRPFCAVNHAVDNVTKLTHLPPHIVLCPEQPRELDSLEPLDHLLDLVSETTSRTRDGELCPGESCLESSPSDQTLETQESSEETKGSFGSDRSGEGLGDGMNPPDPDADLTTPEPNRPTSSSDCEHYSDPERESTSEELDITACEDDDVDNGGDQTPVSLREEGASEMEEATEDKCDGQMMESGCEDVTEDGQMESGCEDVTEDGQMESDREDVTEDGQMESGCEDVTEDGQMEPEALVQMDTACCMSQEGFLFEAPGQDAAPGLGHTSNPPPPPRSLAVVNQEPQALLPLRGDYAFGSPRSGSPMIGLELPVGSSRCSAAEDGSDGAMSASTGSDRAASPLGYGEILTLRQRKKAGQGALRFVRQYPFALQALWCLLSGRTLVVLGADEGRVRRLVAALALFVPAPGRCGERVQPWLSCPFTLTDLQRWKLIGLQRVASPVGSSMLFSLSRYSRYISILDADQKTLRCPPYRGTLLANIADHRTYVRRGSTYFLHVQSTLSGLAARAFLFTFTHHLHLPVSCHEEGPEGVEARRQSFLQEQLGLGDEDGQILLYLGQLVARHYLEQPAATAPAPPGSVATAASAVAAAAPPCFSFKYTTSVLYKI